MVSDWILSTLDEAGIILIDCVHETPPDAGIGYPYIAIPQIKNGYIDFSANPRLIKYSDYKKWTIKANPQADDIVLSRRCNPGETAYVPKGVEFALGQNLVLLRSSGEKVYPPFLRWLVRGPEWWAQVSKYLNVGAVFDSLRCAEIPKFELSIPPLHEQKAIADILGSLDAKIELNRDMNKTLEAMAQALFKSWFVDFDPVIDNALEAGNSIPDELLDRAEQRKKIKKNDNNHAIRSLFPNEFEFSEAMGWTPKGWKIKTVSDVTSEIIDHRGKTPKKLGGDWSESGYPAISAKNIKNNRIVRPDTIRFVDKNIYGKWMKIPLKEGDVLMTSEAPLGELYYLNSKVDYLLSQRLYGIRADGVNCTGSYLFYWFQTEIGSASLQNRATGTTVLGIKQSELRKIGVLCPCLGILEKFEDFSKKYLEKIDSNEILLSQLSNLRDTLLPKLMSGEIRIPEAAVLVEGI